MLVSAVECRANGWPAGFLPVPGGPEYSEINDSLARHNQGALCLRLAL